MVYEWRYFQMPVRAQDAGDHLEALERAHGAITPELVLEDARDSGAMLHDCFEWQDSVAAEKYRLSQAGALIRNLVVVNVQEQKPEKHGAVRAFVNVSEETQGLYKSVGVVSRCPEEREQVLKRAMQELNAFREKYQSLSEFFDVFQAIDRMTA